MTVKDRLLQFMAHVNMSQARFEKHVGLSNGFVNNVGNGLTTKSLQKIKDKYPQLNTSWLLNGEGQMEEELIAFDAGAAIREIKETNAVILAAVAEILAKVSNQSSTVLRDQLEDAVNKRLGRQAPTR